MCESEKIFISKSQTWTAYEYETAATPHNNTANRISV